MNLERDRARRSRVGAFFARHDIETDGLTVILNIGDREAAARLDYAIKSSFKAYELYPGGPVGDIRQFQLRGVKFKVESPLHAPYRIRPEG